MCHQNMFHNIKNIKTSDGFPYILTGNGVNFLNNKLVTIDGMEIVINDRMPQNIAVYGDIAAGYTIIDSFGGYGVLNRPGVNNSGTDKMYGRIFSTAIITSFQAYRLYKIGA